MEHAVFTIEPRFIKESESPRAAYGTQAEPGNHEFTFQTSSLAADRSSRQVAFAEGTSTGDDADLSSCVEQTTPRVSQPSRSSSRSKQRSRSPQQLLHLYAWQVQAGAPQQKLNIYSSSSKSRSRSTSPNRGMSPGSRSGSPSRDLSAQQLAAVIGSSNGRDTSGRAVGEANSSSVPEALAPAVSSKRSAAPLIPLGRPTDADDSYAASNLRSSREALQPQTHATGYAATTAAADSRSAAAMGVDGSRHIRHGYAPGLMPQADPYSSSSDRSSSSSPAEASRSSRQARTPSPMRALPPHLGEGHCVAIVNNSSSSVSKTGRSRSCGRARGAGLLPDIQKAPVDVAHYQWLKIQLAKTSIAADAAASEAHSLQQQRDALQQQAEELQQQRDVLQQQRDELEQQAEELHQQRNGLQRDKRQLQCDKCELQDRVRELEGQVQRLQETDRTADVWEAGVERLLVRLQQQQQQQQQQTQIQEAQECCLHREELQIARECIQHQGRLLKQAKAGTKEQQIELDASAAAARVAWEMYENLIQQLVPLLSKAAGAVDLLNRSDINWLDGTGSSKPYKAGVLQGAKVLAALAQLPHVIKQQLDRRAHKAANSAIPHAVAGAYAAAEAAASAAAGMIAIESMRAATAAARRGASPSRQRQQQQQQQQLLLQQLQHKHQHKQASSHFSVPPGLVSSGGSGEDSPLSRLRSPRAGQPDKLRMQ